ncbi:hypothetical protein [Alkalihalobacillus sp. CinArs1]|uniref:hypothetical protein n=1 Tax=Alkalihalobacillus sp. CinArs1 TaxID=2995314 RepID=UPI0022DE554F|nr:hypothetical protein [Alkalihalobacillus sp. CinArs1]
MSKTLQAYFPTENEAESAKEDMKNYSVTSASVEEIKEDKDLSVDAPDSGQGSATEAGANNDLFFSNETPTGKQEENADPEHNEKHFNYVLSFETSEDDDTELREIVTKHNGAMER